MTRIGLRRSAESILPTSASQYLSPLPLRPLGRPMAKAPCPSQVIVVRYADNIVMGFEHDQALCWRSAPEVDEIVEIKEMHQRVWCRPANSRSLRRCELKEDKARSHP